MKIVITGAAGFIGGELAQRFMAQGHQVAGIDIQPGRIETTDFYPGRLCESVDVKAFQNAELVIHAAYDSTKGARQVNHDGTKLWIRQATDAGAKQQLFFTSYSAHSDAPSEYGIVKYELEKYCLERNILVVRPGLVVGKSGSFHRLAAFLAKSKIVPCLGGNSMRVSLTTIDVLFQVISRFEEMQPGRVYNVFQPQLEGLLDMTKTILRVYRTGGWVIPVPVLVSKMILKTAEWLHVKLPNTYENFMALLKSQAYGYESSYDAFGIASEPLEEIVAKYKNEDR